MPILNAVKLESKYFDCIRVKPDEDRLLREALPRCDWHGCANPATHPAPRGRGREGQYFHFCLDHVRQYNKSYNYFDGMNDEAVAAFQRSAVTGHRPTWRVGLNGHLRTGPEAPRPNGFAASFMMDDPFGFFGRSTLGGGPRAFTERRPVRNAERKCLRTLNLDEDASAREIKARYKALVKRHHPDANGGDRRAEEKLREVIQAYNYLRQSGLC